MAHLSDRTYRRKNSSGRCARIERLARVIRHYHGRREQVNRHGTAHSASRAVESAPLKVRRACPGGSRRPSVSEVWDGEGSVPPASTPISRRQALGG